MNRNGASPSYDAAGHDPPVITKGGSLAAEKRSARAPKKSLPEGKAPSPELTAFQVESISLFVKAAAVLSVPRTAGLVYGLLYATPHPLNLDDMCALLNSSRGGTWEGVDWLRQMGAIERVYLPGQRKDHYRAEVNLRQLAQGLVRLRLEPHLQNAAEHLQRWDQTIDRADPQASFQQDRVKKVANWHRVVSEILPLVKQVAAD